MGPVGTLDICEGLVLVVGETEGDGQAKEGIRRPGPGAGLAFLKAVAPLSKPLTDVTLHPRRPTYPQAVATSWGAGECFAPCWNRISSKAASWAPCSAVCSRSCGEKGQQVPMGPTHSSPWLNTL